MNNIKEIQFAKRPLNDNNLRSKDKKVELVCNMLLMRFSPGEKKAQQFSVKIEPEIAQDNYPLRRKIFRQISHDLKGYYQPYFPAGLTIYTSASNPEARVELATKVDDTEYKITIEDTKNTLDLSKIRTKTDECLKVKSMIENLIKQIVSHNSGLIKFDNRSFFQLESNLKINNNKETLMPGYGTAACITESGLYLRINDKNKFISGKTAYQKLKEIKEKSKNGSFFESANDFFSNKSVLATYGSYRVYQISGITKDKNVENTTIPVKQRDGTIKDLNLYEYYKQQYGMNIQDKAQPLLIEKQRENSNNDTVRYLIPELVYLTGMDDELEKEKEKNSRGLGRRIIGATKLNPTKKMEKIKDFVKYLNNQTKSKKYHKGTNGYVDGPSPNDIRKEWGLDFGEFKKLNGRELAPPLIKYKKNEVRVERGKFRCSEVIKPKDFGKNDWICVTTNNLVSTAKQMIQSLIKCSRNLGVHIDDVHVEGFNARHSEDFIEELKHLDLNSGKKIVLCVLDDKTKHFYSSIKKYLYEQIGIPSQMIHIKNKNQNLSYYSNVLNQMVVKAGGELYNITIHQNIQKNPTMIIGIDSSRAGKGKTKIVMTASFSQSLSSFYTQQIIVENVENSLPDLFRKALDYFNNLYKTYPKYIFIYRQGGNMKQKQKLYLTELPVIQSFFSSLNLDSLQFNYISVNKKTDLKFFQEKGRGYENPQSGTVIDTEVIAPNDYQFYLQPQYVNQGTATPVEYHVLYSTINMPIEDLEKITFYQTFYYWNWPGPIREPAALKFAEVCNGFTSKYLGNDFVHEKLNNTPFYI